MAEKIEAVRMTLEANKETYLAVEASSLVAGGVYVALNWNGAKGGVHMTAEEGRKLAALVAGIATVRDAPAGEPGLSCSECDTDNAEECACTEEELAAQGLRSVEFKEQVTETRHGLRFEKIAPPAEA